MTALPPCFPTLNTELFANLESQILAAGQKESQATIQALINEVYAQVNLLQATIESQLALLNPILALLEAPVSPTAAVTWIATFIESVLTPYVAPIVKLEAQVAAIATAVAGVAEAIATVESQRPDLVLTVPPFPNVTCTL